MERESIHDLSAAYALDALGDQEAVEFEEHLRGCDPCRDAVAALQGTAAALAFAIDGPAPPRELRERILVRARAERSNVVPFPSRRAFRAVSAAAAVAACAALGLGIWAASLSSELGDLRAEVPTEEALAILADASSSHVPLTGADGALVVAPTGEAALVLRSLRPLPDGSYYTAWVSKDGQAMTHAGAFSADDTSEVVTLTEPVPDGGLVAVTIEDRPDAPEPSSDPVIVSTRT